MFGSYPALWRSPGKALRAFSAVAMTIFSTSSARTRAISAIVSMTFAGSLFEPRSFCGDSTGRVCVVDDGSEPAVVDGPCTPCTELK